MMQKLQIIKLPTAIKPEILVHLVGKMADAFFLDSSDFSHPGSRYSYFSYGPKKKYSGVNALAELSLATSHWFAQGTSHDFFSGGYLGVIPYPDHKNGDTKSSNISFGFYEALIVVDEKNKETFAASSFLNEGELLKWVEDFLAQVSQTRGGGEISSRWVSSPQYAPYQKYFERIQDYLCAGDVYQVNLTQAFKVQTSASATLLYERLRKYNPSPYAAFIHLGEEFILSASPELFFKIDGGKIQTKPIKGTRKRVADETKDQGEKKELLGSLKDRAELLMITDLERNDLGKICETGSVQVEKLCELESFATVHHLVSTITGKLKKDLRVSDVFEALFPGGSITGAPKKRAMEIINELEPHSRGYYTGAIGFLGPGRMQFNLPIRTMMYKQGTVDFFAGGGIVVDSQPELEYEEMWWKVEGLIGALNLKREKT